MRWAYSSSWAALRISEHLLRFEVCLLFEFRAFLLGCGPDAFQYFLSLLAGFCHSSFGVRVGISHASVGLALDFLGVGVRFGSGGVGLFYHFLGGLVLASRLNLQPLGLLQDFFAIGDKVLTHFPSGIDDALSDLFAFRLHMDTAVLGEGQLVFHE